MPFFGGRKLSKEDEAGRHDSHKTKVARATFRIEGVEYSVVNMVTCKYSEFPQSKGDPPGNFSLAIPVEKLRKTFFFFF